MSLLWIVILPFVGSFCAAVLPSHARRAGALLAGLIAVTCAVLAAAHYPEVTNGGVVRYVLPWAPTLGLDFSLRMDGYAWLFVMLVAVMGALVVLYAHYYMSPQDPVPRFFAFFLTFMGSMLGVVLSGNLIQLVLFWEMTSMASFMLIAYWHHRVDARRGARMAFTVTTAGGLCLLAGVLMLGRIVGSYDLDVVLVAGEKVRAHSWYPVVLVLIALGALTKSAQFPFQFWLPHAMAAPTPVSAYLHSATMVKAGVFLLARLWPVLAGTDVWFWLIGGVGLCSLLIGGYAAIFQQDMKGVLAYSTVSHLGLITLLLGLNSPLALLAAIFHMANHATFKASLFMAAGMVDHETGTRNLSRLSGLLHAMPITATLALVATASMAGVPLLNGFISKEMFFTEAAFVSGNPIVQMVLPALAVVAGMFSVAYSLRFILQVFFGPPAKGLPRQPHEPPRWMLLPSALLVGVCLLVGILPAQTIGPFLDTAALSVLGPAMPAHSLAVWHGFNLPFMMSLLAMGGGILLYRALRRYQRREPGVVLILDPIEGKRIFNFTLDWLSIMAEWLEQRLSSPRLQVQLLLLVVAAFAAAALPVWHGGLPAGDMPLSEVDPAFALLWLIGAACAIGTALKAKYNRMAALALAGGAGLITCLTFIWFSAPDLALTQFAVEVVTVVLILLGLRWLPPRIEAIDNASLTLRERARSRSRRLRDLVVACVAGGGLAALTYALLTRGTESGPGEGIGPFFVENALPLGGGSNVVNVILVDFRSFDTFGEITVLGIVALTVYALLRRFRPAPESIDLPQHTSRVPSDPRALLPGGHMMVPALLVRMLLPIAVLISLFFLLRGHNAPGGGFVGGLVMATAVILQYMTNGTLWAEARTRIRPQSWIAAGLLSAAGAGLMAFVAGRPFLSALAWHGKLPLLGEMHLSSVLLFDIGVYLLVVGAVTLILVALAHQSLRRHRKPLASAPVAAAVYVAPIAAETAATPATGTTSGATSSATNTGRAA